MTDLRQAAQQALEVEADRRRKALAAEMRAALAQQAEPVEPVARVVEHGATVRLEWVSADAAHNAKVGPLFSMLPQRKPLTEGVLMGVYIDFDRAADPAWSKAEYLLRLFRAIERAHSITDPQVADRLARHGINPCPDCHGLGYDASGQLCWCQQNPSF